MTERTRSLLVRIAVGVIVVGGVVWYLQSRGHGTSTTASAAGPHEGSGGGSGSGSGSGARVVPVQVVDAKTQDLPIWLEGLGTVAAYQQVTLRVQVDGRLDKVLFTEGQAVKRGQVIAQVDPRPFEVQLHTAQGQLARDRAIERNAELTLARNKNLREQNLIAQATVDQSESDVGSARGTVQVDQAAIENAELQLDYASVKSPLDGITGVRLVDAGNIVHATDTTGLVVLTTIDPAGVLFTVPQDRLAGVNAAIARGDVPVEIWNRDGTAKIATGKLIVLDNQINQTTATLRMKALVDNPTRALWPNAFVKARMLLETRKNALVVPTVAIQQGPSGTFVYVVDANHQAQMTPVEVALTSGDLAVISKGLNGGEQVITEGQNQVRPNGKVSATRKGETPGGADAAGGDGAGAGSGQHMHKHGAGSGAGSGSGAGGDKELGNVIKGKPADPPALERAGAGSGSAANVGAGSGSNSHAMSSDAQTDRTRSTSNPTPNVSTKPSPAP